MTLVRNYRLVIGEPSSPSLNALAGAFNWTGAVAEFAFGGFPDALVELPLAGTAQQNADDINSALNDGSFVVPRPGKVDIVPPILVPANGAALWGCGFSREIGTPIQHTVFVPTDVAGVDAVIQNADAGVMTRGALLGNFGFDHAGDGRYNFMQFDGIGDGTVIMGIFGQNCQSLVVLNNAYNDNNACADGAVLREFFVDQHRDAAVAVRRSATNPGPARSAAKFSLYGLDSAHAASTGWPLAFHGLDGQKTRIHVSSFAFAINDVSANVSEAILITDSPKINLSMGSGRLRNASAQNFIDVDSTDHNISVQPLDTGSNPTSPTYPANLIKTPDVNSDIAPLDDGVPTVVLNGRLPAWAA